METGEVKLTVGVASPRGTKKGHFHEKKRGENHVGCVREKKAPHI